MSGKIWITSDLHFCHDRDFIYKPRGFNSVREMNLRIVENWRRVDWNDDVYILGDLMLNNNDEGLNLIKCLSGKLHIICGNHDTDTRRALYENCCNVVEIRDAMPLNYKKYHFFLSHYPTLCDNYDKEMTLRRHVINLCGHTHTSNKFSDMDKGLIYHCELDAHNNCPVLIDDIIEDLKVELI